MMEKLFENDEELTKVIRYLAPWIEKNFGEESIGDWETTLATKMMMNLLKLWMTPKSRARVERILLFYHPVDRCAMAYALLVFLLMGRKMVFKSAVAKQHFKVLCEMLKDDMPELMFADHLKYILHHYGRKKVES